MRFLIDLLQFRVPTTHYLLTFLRTHCTYKIIKTKSRISRMFVTSYIVFEISLCFCVNFLYAFCSSVERDISRTALTLKSVCTFLHCCRRGTGGREGLNDARFFFSTLYVKRRLVLLGSNLQKTFTRFVLYRRLKSRCIRGGKKKSWNKGRKKQTIMPGM